MAQLAVSEMAPLATVIDAAVTDDPSGAPSPYVPPAYVADDHPATYVTATVPSVENVSPEEFVFADPAADELHAVACRAYDPVFAFSLVPACSTPLLRGECR
jgi:hypothetical protein